MRSRDRGIVGEATVDFIRQFKVDIGADRHLGHRGRRHAARLRLPRGEGGARDHRAVARGLARRRPQQVQPAGDGRAGARSTQIDCLFTDAAPPRAVSRAARRGRRASCVDLRGCAMTDKTLPARPRPGHLELAQHRVRRARAASSRWRSASSARSIRSPAGSSTTRWRSGPAQLATAREALAKAGLTARRHRARSASPTSARPRWCGTASTGEPIAQRHRLAGPARRAAVRRSCAQRGLEPTDPREDRAGHRRLLLRHQARAGCSTTCAGARAAAAARRAGLRHRRQLADVAADRRHACTPPT